MAFTSLLNMTVPLPGTPNQGLLMPKLQYRFRVIFTNFGVEQPSTEMTKQVIDFSRPNLEFPEIPIEIYNSRYYVAGKPTWSALTLNVRDDAGSNVQALVGQQIQKQFDFSEQASAASGIDYKFMMTCQVLDGGNGVGDASPGVLESWEIYGCYIASANYNQLSYSANEPCTIALSIRFDNAVQAPVESYGQPEVGVGLSFPRTQGDVVTGIGPTGL